MSYEQCASLRQIGVHLLDSKEHLIFSPSSFGQQGLLQTRVGRVNCDFVPSIVGAPTGQIASGRYWIFRSAPAEQIKRFLFLNVHDSIQKQAIGSCCATGNSLFLRLQAIDFPSGHPSVRRWDGSRSLLLRPPESPGGTHFVPVQMPVLHPKGSIEIIKVSL